MRASAIAIATVLVAGVSGCGKSSTTSTDKTGGGSSAGSAGAGVVTPPEAPKAPKGTPRPQGKLTVTVDGKAVPMVGAVVYEEQRQRHFVVSSVPLDCAAVTDPYGRALAPDEVTFETFIVQALQPDGTLAPWSQGTGYGGMYDQHGGKAVMTGEGAPGQATTLDVDFSTHDMAKPAHALVVKGTIDALGCPAKVQTPPLDPLPAPMKATLEVAGKSLPIRGALLHPGKFTTLQLVTGGETCKPTGSQAPSEVSVNLSWFDAAKPEVNQVQLLGTLLMSGPADQTFDKTKLTVTPTPVAAGETTLAGDIVVGGYPVKLTGTVTVTDCSK